MTPTVPIAGGHPAEAPVNRWYQVSTVRARSALWLVLLLIPPFIVALWIQGQWRNHERQDTAVEAARLAQRAAALHVRLLDGSRQWLDGVSKTLAALPPDVALVRRILEGRLAAEPQYLDVGVVDPEGKIVVSGRSPGREGDLASLGSLDVFRRALETRAFAIGNYDVDGSSGRSSVTVLAPIIDGAGTVSHVLFAVVHVGWLAEFAREAQFPAGTVMALVNGGGHIVLHEPEPARWVGRSVPDALRAHLGSAGVISAQARSEDGVDRLYGLHAVASHPGDLSVVVGIPRAVATVQASPLISLTVAAFGLAGLMTIMIAVVGAEVYFLRPVTTIVKTARRLSRGDLGARTGLPRRGDELNQLATSVDEMAAALQERERETREHHEALARQQRRYHALIENSSDAVVLIDDEERVVYASPSSTRVIGCSIDDLVGHDAFERLHPDDRGWVRQVLAEVVRDPAAPKSACYRVKHEDGSWRWIEAVAMNLRDEPSVGAVVANYRDITDRRMAEDALHRAHEQLETRVEERTAALVSANAALEVEVAVRASIEKSLRKLTLAIEQTGDCVFISDAHGIIEYVNPAFEALTGYSREEAIGAKTNLMKSGRHSAAFYQALWGRITAGEVFTGVVLNRAKDGHLYYEDKAISPILDKDGRITHYVSTGRDITHRKRTDEALRRLHDQLENEAKRIASALHDEAGRFLMTAHITLADVAREVPPQISARLVEVRRDLDQVEEQLRRLSHELRPRILDDLGLVEALKFLGEGVMRRTGVNVSIQASIDGRYERLVETALYRMVQEALTNIGKHARATRATVVLQEEDHTVYCSIRDDGLGFDVAALNRAGERSLGLVGIRDRLEAVGGTLEIVATPGGGTELRTAVPLETT